MACCIARSEFLRRQPRDPAESGPYNAALYDPQISMAAPSVCPKEVEYMRYHNLLSRHITVRFALSHSRVTCRLSALFSTKAAIRTAIRHVPYNTRSCHRAQSVAQRQNAQDRGRRHRYFSCTHGCFSLYLLRGSFTLLIFARTRKCTHSARPHHARHTVTHTQTHTFPS